MFCTIVLKKHVSLHCILTHALLTHYEAETTYPPYHRRPIGYRLHCRAGADAQHYAAPRTFRQRLVLHRRLSSRGNKLQC